MGTTTRLMMTRATLHLVGTVCAFAVVYLFFPHGGMWVRMATYALVWVACGGAYFAALYLWQSAIDKLEVRIRDIVRDELTTDEMRHYHRRLKFLTRYYKGKSMR